VSELFEVRLTRSAEKDLLDLRELTEKATKKILALKQAPYKGHPLKGRLKGVRALEFSLKGVAYRAAYVVLSEVGAGRKGERVCLVFTVGAHEGFYEKAERRAEALMK
jgi:hypothetical protein